MFTFKYWFLYQAESPSCPVIQRFRLCSPSKCKSTRASLSKQVMMKGRINGILIHSKPRNKQILLARYVAKDNGPNPLAFWSFFSVVACHRGGRIGTCQWLACHQLLKAFFPASSKPWTINVPSWWPCPYGLNPIHKASAGYPKKYKSYRHVELLRDVPTQKKHWFTNLHYLILQNSIHV